MAEIQSIHILDGHLEVTVLVPDDEFNRLKLGRNAALVPIEPSAFEETLTTGKIGNGNRIMIPNRLLAKYEIERLRKKVPAKLFQIEEAKYLLIKLEENLKGVPNFEGDE